MVQTTNQQADKHYPYVSTVFQCGKLSTHLMTFQAPLQNLVDLISPWETDPSPAIPHTDLVVLNIRQETGVLCFVHMNI